jgi:hypothetical protein
MYTNKHLLFWLVNASFAQNMTIVQSIMGPVFLKEAEVGKETVGLYELG